MAKSYGSVNGQSKEIKKLYGSVNGLSKEITKLYGSVNGVSKLIYGSGSSTSPYGIVYYKTNASDTEVKSVEIQSVTEFNGLCRSDNDDMWTTTINGVTVSNGYDEEDPIFYTNVIVGVDIGTDITTISDGFLYSCYYLNSEIIIPDSVTSIGDYFIGHCGIFNSPITLSSSLTYVGYSFLEGCKQMTSVVNVGSLDASKANGGPYSFSAASTNDPAYATGITIAGANRAAWLSRFPNRTRFPYRKLIDAGY